MILLVGVGCATVNDVRQASQLIHTDNQLAALLAARSDKHHVVAQAELVSLGEDARKQAETLELDPSAKREAIAYYRIAATAFWQSGSSEAVDRMFGTVANGRALCESMPATKVPDRDYLFLKLLLPLAAFEASARADAGQADALEQVDFTDQENTASELETLKAVFRYLQAQKRLIREVDSLRDDRSLAGHTGMQAYYEENSRRIHQDFEGLAGVLLEALDSLERHFPAHSELLKQDGLDQDSARLLRFGR